MVSGARRCALLPVLPGHYSSSTPVCSSVSRTAGTLKSSRPERVCLTAEPIAEFCEQPSFRFSMASRRGARWNSRRKPRSSRTRAASSRQAASPRIRSTLSSGDVARVFRPHQRGGLLIRTLLHRRQLQQRCQRAVPLQNEAECSKSCGRPTSRSSGRASVASFSESAMMFSMSHKPRHSARISAALRGLRAATFCGSRAPLNSSVGQL